MNELMEARARINVIDSQMAALFSQRWEAVRDIARYKMERGIPILDQGREREILEKNSALIPTEDIRASYISFMQHELDLSKQFQHMLMEGMNVAYSGIPGAFSDIASRRIFTDARQLGFPDFTAAYNAVVNGDCDCTLLPIKNSITGIFGQVIDLLFTGNLFINGMYQMSLEQNLVGVEGATPETVRQVISRPDMLNQCEKYISSHGYEMVTAADTALAAMRVAELNDPAVAAITSRATAEHYGLKVLDPSIDDNAANVTRFAVLSRIENRNSDKRGIFILMFTVPDAAGSLAKAITVISDHGYNMKVLRAHALKSLAWQDCFYVEAEGDETTENGREMLEELGTLCGRLKVVGHYQKEVEI